MEVVDHEQDGSREPPEALDQVLDELPPPPDAAMLRAATTQAASSCRAARGRRCWPFDSAIVRDPHEEVRRCRFNR